MKAIYLISVILYFVSITLFMSSYEIKKKTRHWVFIFLTLLTLSAMWIITPYLGTVSRNSNKYSFKRDIRVNTINGDTISIDTVYVIKPR